MSATYDINLDAIAPLTPNQDGWATTAGTYAVTSDGTHKRLRNTTTNAIESIVFPGGSQVAAFTFTCRVTFDNTANPVASYVFPGFRHQAAAGATQGNEYQLVLSRGTSEARGALWLQRYNGVSTDLPDGAAVYVGVSGTTFAQNETYDVTVGVSGTVTVPMTVQVQRVSDSKYLKSDGTWQVAVQTALSITDVSGSALVRPGNVSVNMYASTLDGYLYGLTITDGFDLTFIRQSTSPVLTKGGTYDGWTADALAAPAVVWDTIAGNRYLMSVSAWSIANAQWATLFFTATDLRGTWTYVTGSILIPGSLGTSGTDYIFGNGGLAIYGGKYFIAVNHYASAAATFPVGVFYSTDTTLAPASWSTVSTSLIADALDPQLVLNPNNSKMELLVTKSNHTEIDYWDTATGTTALSWTNEGLLFSGPDYTQVFTGSGFGEGDCCFLGAVRYLNYDFPPNVGQSARITGMAYDPTGTLAWAGAGVALYRSHSNSWESAQVFDLCTITTDTGDGYGNVVHALYAGGDTNTLTDNTNSSIGLAVISTATAHQIAYPISDVSAGSWTASTGTDLYATIDETVASDTDYDQSGVSPSNDTMEVQLTSLSTPSTGDVTFTVRHRIH